MTIDRRTGLRRIVENRCQPGSIEPLRGVEYDIDLSIVVVLSGGKVTEQARALVADQTIELLETYMHLMGGPGGRSAVTYLTFAPGNCGDIVTEL